MSTARWAPKRSAVSESNDDGQDIIDLCSVSSGDTAVRVAAGSAAAVSDASVDSESEESDSGSEAEGKIARFATLDAGFQVVSLPMRVCRRSCARV